MKIEKEIIEIIPKCEKELEEKLEKENICLENMSFILQKVCINGEQKSFVDIYEGVMNDLPNMDKVATIELLDLIDVVTSLTKKESK